MGLYIKDLDLPSKEAIEPGLSIEFACGIDGKMYARLYHYRAGGLTDWKEAVSVPDHGDLIDRDVLLKKTEDVCETYGGGYSDSGFSRMMIEDEPAVISGERKGGFDV